MKESPEMEEHFTLFEELLKEERAEERIEQFLKELQRFVALHRKCGMI